MNPFDLEAWLAPHETAVREIVRRAREVLLRLIPDAVETHDRENLGYGYDRGYKGLVFTLAPHKKHVTLGIFDGVNLPDPAGLMAGSGKRHRHVKLTSPAELTDPALLTLLETAVATKPDPRKG